MEVDATQRRRKVRVTDMALSEQEQRLLDEMERNLYSKDADFVSTGGAGRGRPSYRNISIGAVVAVVGIGVLILAVALASGVLSIALGVAGFIVMFAGVIIALTPSKKLPRKLAPEQFFQPAGKPAQGAAPQQRAAGFMDRMNDRWDKRDEGNR